MHSEINKLHHKKAAGAALAYFVKKKCYNNIICIHDILGSVFVMSNNMLVLHNVCWKKTMLTSLVLYPSKSTLRASIYWKYIDLKISYQFEIESPFAYSHLIMIFFTSEHTYNYKTTIILWLVVVLLTYIYVCVVKVSLLSTDNEICYLY